MFSLIVFKEQEIFRKMEYFTAKIQQWCIFLNGNVWIPIEISLKFVHGGPINNFPALVQLMAW